MDGCRVRLASSLLNRYALLLKMEKSVEGVAEGVAVGVIKGVARGDEV